MPARRRRVHRTSRRPARRTGYPARHPDLAGGGTWQAAGGAGAYEDLTAIAAWQDVALSISPYYARYRQSGAHIDIDFYLLFGSSGTASEPLLIDTGIPAATWAYGGNKLCGGSFDIDYEVSAGVPIYAQGNTWAYVDSGTIWLFFRVFGSTYGGFDTRIDSGDKLAVNVRLENA